MSNGRTIPGPNSFAAYPAPTKNNSSSVSWATKLLSTDPLAPEEAAEFLEAVRTVMRKPDSPPESTASDAESDSRSNQVTSSSKGMQSVSMQASLNSEVSDAIKKINAAGNEQALYSLAEALDLVLPKNLEGDARSYVPSSSMDSFPSNVANHEWLQSEHDLKQNEATLMEILRSHHNVNLTEGIKLASTFQQDSVALLKTIHQNPPGWGGAYSAENLLKSIQVQEPANGLWGSSHFPVTDASLKTMSANIQKQIEADLKASASQLTKQFNNTDFTHAFPLDFTKQIGTQPKSAASYVSDIRKDLDAGLSTLARQIEPALTDMRKKLESEMMAISRQIEAEQKRIAAEAAQANAPVNGTTPSSNSSLGANAAALLRAINDARIRHGLRPLAESANLTRAAQENDAANNRTGTLGHHIGLKYGSLGEITASRSNGMTPQAAVDLWLRSPPHRQILLGSNYTSVGVSISGNFATAEFR